MAHKRYENIIIFVICMHKKVNIVVYHGPTLSLQMPENKNRPTNLITSIVILWP